MKPTDRLREDHQAIKLMLRILGALEAKLEAGEVINLEHFEQILEFITVFTDACHHGKEEQLLFPALEEVGIPKEGGPIGVMLTEHRLGREYVQGMREGLAGHRKGDRNATAQLIDYARRYMRHLNQHIEKEDMILFQMADSHLSMETQDELIRDFERLENEKIGVARHEEFHKMLHHLEAVYLR